MHHLFYAIGYIFEYLWIGFLGLFRTVKTQVAEDLAALEAAAHNDMGIAEQETEVLYTEIKADINSVLT